MARKTARASARNAEPSPAMSKPPSSPAPTESGDSSQTSTVQSVITQDLSDDLSMDVVSTEIADPSTEQDDSLPWVIDDNSFIARALDDGAYPKMLAAFKTWKADPSVVGRVASFMEYGTDIKAFPGTFGQHVVYRKTRDTPLQMVFFGEIAPHSYGTALGAKGNHYVGTTGHVRSASVISGLLLKYRQRIKIDDRKKVWNAIALRPPSEAPEELIEMYKDQISFLNIIVCEDNEIRAKRNEPVRLCLYAMITH